MGYQSVSTVNKETAALAPFCHRFSELIFKDGFNQSMLEHMATDDYRQAIKNNPAPMIDLHIAFEDAGAYQQTVNMAFIDKTSTPQRRISCHTLFARKQAIITYALQEINKTLYLTGLQFELNE